MLNSHLDLWRRAEIIITSMVTKSRTVNKYLNEAINDGVPEGTAEVTQVQWVQSHQEGVFCYFFSLEEKNPNMFISWCATNRWMFRPVLCKLYLGGAAGAGETFDSWKNGLNRSGINLRQKSEIQNTKNLKELTDGRLSSLWLYSVDLGWTHRWCHLTLSWCGLGNRWDFSVKDDFCLPESWKQADQAKTIIMLRVVACKQVLCARTGMELLERTHVQWTPGWSRDSTGCVCVPERLRCSEFCRSLTPTGCVFRAQHGAASSDGWSHKTGEVPL